MLLMCTLTICVLMVEGRSAVVNVMLSLMSVMSPPPALCNLSLRTVVKLCTLGVFDFRGELGFLNCDNVCMRVVNKQFELLEFVFESVYVHLHFDRFYKQHCQPSSGSGWPACPKNGNRASIVGGGRGRHNLHRVCHTTVTALPRVGSVFWNPKPHVIN